MRKNKTLLVLVMFILSLKIYSQTNQLDAIIDTSANFSNNMDYNIGEVFVVFNNTMISKQSNPNNLLADLPTKTICVYPNPVSNILHIKDSEYGIINNVIVLSIDGRKIFDKRITNNQVDFTNLPNGIYLLKTNLSDSLTFKIIKQ